MAFVDAESGAILYEKEGEGTIVLAGTVTKGDILGYSAGWKIAIATTGGVVQARCVAGEDGVSGQRIVVYFDRVVMGGRFSGGTAGAALYVAEASGEDGHYIETAPSTSGDATKKIGYMVSASIGVITPLYADDSTVA
uniref:Uncharacterized protein n=1 Tax=viral metagenome TaxID=1070528 RepID=A0A6H1ZIT8_9ZZZZ